MDQGSQFAPPEEMAKAAFALHWASYAQASPAPPGHVTSTAVDPAAATGTPPGDDGPAPRQGRLGLADGRLPPAHEVAEHLAQIFVKPGLRDPAAAVVYAFG
ncbi:hypothetical protein [Streptomyces brevispora]|uniref:hypothetical protein n=1 Tax=Streptomyces brevispora TaxID=887462 RepID=UPI0038151701